MNTSKLKIINILSNTKSFLRKKSDSYKFNENMNSLINESNEKLYKKKIFSSSNKLNKINIFNNPIINSGLSTKTKSHRNIFCLENNSYNKEFLRVNLPNINHNISLKNIFENKESNIKNKIIYNQSNNNIHNNDNHKISLYKKRLKIDENIYKVFYNLFHCESNRILNTINLEIFEKNNYLKNFYTQEIIDNNKYDESKIFNKKKYYDEFIKNKIIELKNNKKNENLTDFFEKKFEDEKDNNIIINLNSIKIKFISEDKNNPLKLEFNLPFSLLPIFYFKEVISTTDIKKIIALIVKFKDKNFNKIEINEKPIFNYINNIDFNINKNNNDNNNNFYDNIEFQWKTPKYLFKVIIIAPKINLLIEKRNIKIKKFLNYELLFFLYEKKFILWDYYLFNYLFSFKKFRKIISKMNSYLLNNSIYNNSIINLDEKIKSLKYDDYNQNDFIMINTKENNICELYEIKCGCLIISFDLFEIDYNVIEKEEIFQLNLLLIKKIYEIFYKIKKPFDFIKKFFNLKFYNNRNNYYINFEKKKLIEINVNNYLNIDKVEKSFSRANSILKNKINNNNNNNNNKLEEFKKSLNTNNNNNLLNIFPEDEKYTNDFNLNIKNSKIISYEILNNNLIEKINKNLTKKNEINLFYLTKIENWINYFINKILPDLPILNEENIENLNENYNFDIKKRRSIKIRKRDSLKLINLVRKKSFKF